MGEDLNKKEERTRKNVIRSKESKKGGEAVREDLNRGKERTRKSVSKSQYRKKIRGGRSGRIVREDLYI